MESADFARLIPWITLALVVILLAIVWVRGKPATVASAAGDIQSAAETAKTLVMAAEQLWLTGSLPKDARLDFVLEQLQEQYPWLSADQARTSAEAGVYWLKHLIRSVPSA
jgi:hypothetical protein